MNRSTKWVSFDALNGKDDSMENKLDTVKGNPDYPELIAKMNQLLGVNDADSILGERDSENKGVYPSGARGYGRI